MHPTGAHLPLNTSCTAGTVHIWLDDHVIAQLRRPKGRPPHHVTTHAASFDEVSAIVAYKLDELTTDLVCCDIVKGAGGDQQIRTIHEELPGFDAAMESLETLPGFNPQWLNAVVLPPFATNRTVVYDRNACA